MFDPSQVLLVALLLGVCVSISVFLEKKKKAHWVPESVVYMLIGFLSALIMIGASSMYKTSLSFDPDLFFYGLLPAIMLDAGYNGNRRHFFTNFGSICIFAVFGVLISTLIVAFGVSFGCDEGWFGAMNLTTSDSLQFGALLSATDPVATLAILGSPEVNIDVMLFSVLLGESVLNDASAVVLFETIGGTHPSSLGVEDAFLGILEFLGRTLGSIFLGLFVALLSSFAMKMANFHQGKFSASEVLLVLLASYVAYCCGVLFNLSGVMSLFFCGVTLSKYNHYNLSEEGQDVVRGCLKVLALGANTCVFLYLGIISALSLYSDTGYVWNLPFVIYTTFLCVCARGVQIFFISPIVNLGRREPLTYSMQFLCWFAGLRGVMAFALSLEIEGSNGPLLVTTTLGVCLISTVVCAVCATRTVACLHVKGFSHEDLLSMDERMTMSLASIEGANLHTTRRRLPEELNVAWHKFNEYVMKPIFGGRPRSERTPLVDDVGSERRSTRDSYGFPAR